MTQQRPGASPAPGSGDGASNYQLYIRAKQVEQAWPEIPGRPLSGRFGPLLVSFEITLKILQESLDEAVGRLHLNSGRKCEAVAACLNSQLRLLAELAAREAPGGRSRGDAGVVAGAPEAIRGPASSESVWREVLEKLGRMRDGAGLRAELDLRYRALTQALDFDLGLNDDPGFDYDKWVKPSLAHALYSPDRRRDYPEDALFVRAHQVCEGLLEAMRGELRDIEQALYQANYLAAESRVLTAARLARLLDEVFGLLGEMSQAEYASLRLAQGDVDISRSPRWRTSEAIIRDHFWLFVQQLKNYGLDPFLVFVNHREHVVEHRLLQAFRSLSGAMRESLSSHALLMRNIRGSDAVGDIGRDGPGPASPDASPALPELVGALDRLTLWSGLKYARKSGAIIRELEDRHGLAGKYDRAPPAEPSARSRMLRTLDRYFAALREGDRRAWLGLFGDSPYLEDPRGSRPAVSGQELESRFRNLRNLFPRIDSCEYRVLGEGDNFLRVQWTIAGASFLENIPASATRDQLFHFDAEGRICFSVADWEPENLAERLLEQHREAMLDAIGRID